MGFALKVSASFEADRLRLAARSSAIACTIGQRALPAGTGRPAVARDLCGRRAELPVQLLLATGWTGGLLLVAYKTLELVAAVATDVFVNRHEGNSLHYKPVKACLLGKNSSDHREWVLAVVR